MKKQRKTRTPVLILLLVGLAGGSELPPWAQKIPVAIPDFEANGISQTEVIALTDRLRNELFRLGEYDVVERGLMEDILTEQNFQLTGCISNECLVEVGRLMGARQVIGGRISRIGDLYTVSARVVDVQSGKVLGVSDYDLQGGLEEMLTAGMAEVARGLAGPVVEEPAVEESIAEEPAAEIPEEEAVTWIPLEPATEPVEEVQRKPVIGVKGGLNLAGVGGVSTGMSAGGPGAGGFIDVPVVGKWWLGFELLYATKGFSHHGTVQLNYIDLPVLLKFSFDERAMFYVGPYLSLYLNGRIDVGGERHALAAKQVNRLDYGISFGGSYALGKVILETRYTAGISPVFTTADITHYGTIENYGITSNVLLELMLGIGI